METDLIQVVTCSICISVNRFSRVRVTIFFYLLLFDCPTAKSRPLSWGKSHSTDFNHCDLAIWT